MNPERVEVLQHKIDRADRIIKFSLVGAAVVVVITLVVIIFQLAALNTSVQNSLIESRKNAAENHQRTQEYVKCIAVTLLKPVAQRKPEAAAPPKEPEMPAPSQPTTSAPPNPEQTSRPNVIDRVQNSLKELLNGVESTVDTIEKGL